MTTPLTGQCLCGAVKFKVEASPTAVFACHCGMCRRWAGGIALYLDIEGAPQFEGEDRISLYRSSEWGERGFCSVCGSNLFWRVAGQSTYAIAAGTIDATTACRLAKEIFTEDQPAYYTFANETVRQTGKEAMAAYIGSPQANDRT